MYDIPPEYLTQPEIIPDFWRSTVEDVTAFLGAHIHRGVVETIGASAGGRPVRAVAYGAPREGRGTTTFSGALGFRDVRAYIGPDYEKRVYMAMGSVHGAEFEGIVGIVNLLAVLETGCDLRGKAWPALVDAAADVERIVLVPIANPDGRARVPLRMQTHHGQTFVVQEYLNTGGRPDGSLIGWPQCKEHIPLDFSTTQFPGGYPNDAGVNIQHDDFFGQRQPETQALFDLTARERPDLILNMHTGAPGNNYFTRMHRPFAEPALTPAFEALYRRVHTRLAVEGLQSTPDAARNSNQLLHSAQPFCNRRANKIRQAGAGQHLCLLMIKLPAVEVFPHIEGDPRPAGIREQHVRTVPENKQGQLFFMDERKHTADTGFGGRSRPQGGGAADFIRGERGKGLVRLHLSIGNISQLCGQFGRVGIHRCFPARVVLYLDHGAT